MSAAEKRNVIALIHVRPVRARRGDEDAADERAERRSSSRRPPGAVPARSAARRPRRGSAAPRRRPAGRSRSRSRRRRRARRSGRARRERERAEDEEADEVRGDHHAPAREPVDERPDREADARSPAGSRRSAARAIQVPECVRSQTSRLSATNASQVPRPEPKAAKKSRRRPAHSAEQVDLPPEQAVHDSGERRRARSRRRLVESQGEADCAGEMSPPELHSTGHVRPQPGPPQPGADAASSSSMRTRSSGSRRCPRTGSSGYARPPRTTGAEVELLDPYLVSEDPLGTAREAARAVPARPDRARDPDHRRLHRGRPARRARRRADRRQLPAAARSASCARALGRGRARGDVRRGRSGLLGLPPGVPRLSSTSSYGVVGAGEEALATLCSDASLGVRSPGLVRSGTG